MGGGDLNLKKSWHPSTMKNIEKVWKAQQQDSQEKKKIAELKRDIEMERDKEGLTRYAMEQGIIEKKDDKKLDWMYKGPQQSINREDYLTGKKIDKTFEQFVQAEKNTERNRLPSNHVEHECVPPSLRFFSGNEQVDLAKKLQEDPLYAIKKKEMESKSKLLKNPVKLKKLQELVSNNKLSSSSQHKSSRNDKDSDRSKKDKSRRQPQKKTMLSDKEKLKRLKEMMANASWREKERKKNIKRYKDQEKIEPSDKTYNNDFIRKELAKAAEVGTVASRIKSNINNIQRSERTMNTNFAKR
ncbi:pre-mRNA-splicing factor CWC25 homolog isoform X1 [Microplitis mediator]|uniref:pre-mRNA-splicing factor CWC25 homolog isoform X1 n=1 Tax=Microplitis mediator TaxID=375433 RepID=UPI0025542EF8|nr:pre-mRNA-splicing factor CWC25 homolog isoform X1 [Microplitis mediator]